MPAYGIRYSAGAGGAFYQPKGARLTILLDLLLNEKAKRVTLNVPIW